MRQEANEPSDSHGHRKLSAAEVFREIEFTFGAIFGAIFCPGLFALFACMTFLAGVNVQNNSDWVHIQLHGEHSGVCEHRHDALYYMVVFCGFITLLVPIVVTLTSQTILNQQLTVPLGSNPFTLFPLVLWGIVMYAGMLFLSSCGADMLGVAKGGISWQIAVKPLSFYFMLNLLVFISSNFPQGVSGLSIGIMTAILIGFAFLYRLTQLTIAHHRIEFREYAVRRGMWPMPDKTAA